MISSLEKLKKMHAEKPWLYEEEEHAVLKLAEDAVALLQEFGTGVDDTAFTARAFLEEHK